MRLLWIIATMILGFVVQSAAQIHTETVEYKIGSDTFEGYLAYDQSIPGKRPGVLVFHEWKGIQPYEKMRAEQLAKLGYVAFVPDIYGKGIRPQTPQDAGAEAGKYRNNRPLMREHAIAGLEQLKKNSIVDPGRIAAIGYCFGGTVALELARSGAEIAGAVSFHGVPDTPNPSDARNIRGKVLLLHGADDPYVKRESITAFEDEMNGGNVDWEIVIYSHAVHGFTNPNNGSDPSKGAAYNEAADHRSWDDMKQFFAEIFKK